MSSAVNPHASNLTPQTTSGVIVNDIHSRLNPTVARGGLLDTRRYNAVRSFDRERGLIEVESGIRWRPIEHTGGRSNWLSPFARQIADELER